MSQVTVIDSLEFAREGGEFSGDLEVAALTRLHDQLAGDKAGTVACRLRGGREVDGKPSLKLEVEGVLELRCQRCLEPLRHPLRIARTLCLLREGEEPPEDDLEDENRDYIPADRAMDVAALVEDEILLALPVAPRHGDCRPPTAGSGNGKPSPFAVLAALKKH